MDKMEVIKIMINNNLYMFICDEWVTSKAWGHKVTMLRNNTEYTTQKITYYNRTWESYEYQTCIFKCIDTIIEEEITYIINTYKETNDRKRLSQKEKNDIINTSGIIKELKELKKIL